MAPATKIVAEEAKLTRERANNPLIAVDFEFARGGWIINVIVENVGTGLARDIQVDFAPGIPAHETAPITSLPVNAGIIPFLKPGQRFVQFVDGALAFFSDDAKKPMGYRATVHAKNADGVSLGPAEYFLDLSIYRGSRIADEKGLDDIAKSLKEIANTLSKVVAWDAIKVKTPRDIVREGEEWRRRVEEIKAQETATSHVPQN